MTTDLTNGTGAPDRAMRSTYVAIVLIETAVIAGLWFFGWYFGR